MKEIENFFDVAPHSIPEMKLIGSVDWLHKGDYNVIVETNKIEVHLRTFVLQAMNYLENFILTNMVQLMQRGLQTAKKDMTNINVSDLTRSIEIAYDALSVSSICNFSLIYLTYKIMNMRQGIVFDNKTFDKSLVELVKLYALVYLPPTRSIKGPGWYQNRLALQQSTEKFRSSIIDLCYHTLGSPYSQVGAVCLVSFGVLCVYSGRLTLLDVVERTAPATSITKNTHS